MSFGGWARVGTPSRSAPYSLKPDILDRRAVRGDGSNGMIWMEIKPVSLSGIARAGAAWGTYSSMLTGFSADTTWLRGGRMFQVSDGSNMVPTLVFNAGGIVLYNEQHRLQQFPRDHIIRARSVSSCWNWHCCGRRGEPCRGRFRACPLPPKMGRK